jgi:hypothetical protein
MSFAVRARVARSRSPLEMKQRTARILPIGAQREFLIWIKLIYPALHPAMKRKSPFLTPEPTEAEIQHAAYLMWIEDGRPEGRDFERWMAAKEMLCHRHGRDAKIGRRAPEIAAPARVA